MGELCVWSSAVYEGDYMGQRVAVKIIKCDVTAQAFLQETTVMTWVWRRPRYECFPLYLWKHWTIWESCVFQSLLNEKLTNCDHISENICATHQYLFYAGGPDFALRRFTFTRKLQHKNLVRLFGVILHKGLHIVTELMTKVQLHTVIYLQFTISIIKHYFIPRTGNIIKE